MEERPHILSSQEMRRAPSFIERHLILSIILLLGGMVLFWGFIASLFQPAP